MRNLSAIREILSKGAALRAVVYLQNVLLVDIANAPTAIGIDAAKCYCAIRQDINVEPLAASDLGNGRYQRVYHADPVRARGGICGEQWKLFPTPAAELLIPSRPVSDSAELDRKSDDPACFQFMQSFHVSNRSLERNAQEPLIDVWPILVKRDDEPSDVFHFGQLCQVRIVQWRGVGEKLYHRVRESVVDLFADIKDSPVQKRLINPQRNDRKRKIAWERSAFVENLRDERIAHDSSLAGKIRVRTKITAGVAERQRFKRNLVGIFQVPAISSSAEYRAVIFDGIKVFPHSLLFKTTTPFDATA